MTRAERLERLASRLVCPRCRSRLDLDLEGEHARCVPCTVDYPLRDGRLWLRSDATSVERASETAYRRGWRGRLRQSRWYRPLFKLFSPVLVTGPDAGRRFAEIAERGGLVVDLGSGNDRRHPAYVNIDLIAYPEVDLVAEAGSIPLDDGIVDAVVNIVVLEHVPDAVVLISELHRILKPGGRAFIVAPFLQPFHAAPHDYRRWTAPGLEREFQGFERRDGGVYGGPASAVAWLLAECLALLLSLGSSRLQSALSLPLQALCSPFKWIDLITARLPGAERLASVLWIEVERRDLSPTS